MLADLLDACPALRSQAARRKIVFGINVRFQWPATGKRKTLDLALGPPDGGSPAVPPEQPIVAGRLADVLLSCEAKSVMTEHGKSQPRVYDELSSSHEIVHAGRADAIATGLTVVNIARTFVSPLRQTSAQALHISRHHQPAAAAAMIRHLRGLRVRSTAGEVGFDAYATIVVDCDNQGAARLDGPAGAAAGRSRSLRDVLASRQRVVRSALPAASASTVKVGVAAGNEVCASSRRIVCSASRK